ncbi:unnamed protein product [Closterium sp. NIES-65]|nr:unnamed protein product [Closterium sp. NIES-65]CAI6010436.1 unnamed protein product [Closterium sp. NIES-65]
MDAHRAVWEERGGIGAGCGRVGKLSTSLVALRLWSFPKLWWHGCPPCRMGGEGRGVGEAAFGGAECERGGMWEGWRMGGAACGRGSVWEGRHVGGVACGRGGMWEGWSVRGVACGRGGVWEGRHVEGK